MIRSFEELFKRQDDLTAQVRDVFGEGCVGTFGIGLTQTPVKRLKRKRRLSVESEGSSEEQEGEPLRTGIVRNILIEAKRPLPDEVGNGMYLSTWEGYDDLQCSWVRESGMSKATKDWWLVESEMRYPGYSKDDYPVYDEKNNTLDHSPSSNEFLKSIPLGMLQSETPLKIFMELVAKSEFNAWNFIRSLIGETSIELFFRITETLVDVDRKVPIEAKFQIPEISPPTPPSAPAPRRLRLIVSSSSSEEEKELKSKERHYSYRGQPAYLVREIRGERVLRGRTEYHVFWKGYESSEATWEPSGNVNREAINIWNAKKRKLQ